MHPGERSAGVKAVPPPSFIHTPTCCDTKADACGVNEGGIGCWTVAATAEEGAGSIKDGGGPC